VGRKKKNQITIKDPETLAVLGIICMILSVLLTLAYFSDQPALAPLASWFGQGVIVMAIVLFLTGLRLLGTERSYNSMRVIIFLFLFLIFFLGWIHLFTNPLEAKTLGEKGHFGGIIGYYVSEWFKQFSIEVAFSLLSIFMVISFMSALSVSPRQLSEWIVMVIDWSIDIGKWIHQKTLDLIDFIKESKAKIDNLELSIVGSEDKDMKKSKKESKADNEDDEESLFDKLSIKMVSDISGKNKLEEEEKPAINLYNLSKPAQTARKPIVKEAKEPVQDLDLSERNYPDWKLPPLDLLDPVKPKQQDSKSVIERKGLAIIETLKSFNIEAKILGYTIGPAVTQYFIDPAAGIKFSKIANLSKDLALTLASPSDLRIELVPGKSYIGIDVPNDIRQMTQLRESIEPIYDNPDKYTLGLAVGIDTQGNPICRDLASAPHLLVAGATGQGKSVLVNAFIISLLMQKSPDELKFIMIDPKMVEMAPYDGIPHLLTPPITDMSKAAQALKWAVNEMEERYKVLKEARVRNIADYTAQTGKLMPYIVVLIDEFSDLMMQFRQDVESSIIRLAQKSRAVGIHLVIATQRPTADVITGLIKSNIPTRVALSVASSMDSRVILDSTGAETLLGKGDLLFKTANDLKPVRVQGLYIDDKGAQSEFNKILNFIKEQAPDVEYNDDAILTIPSEGGEAGDFSSDDPLFRQAAEIVVGAQKGSASLLQTKMKIGYARAARLIDELEMAGIVGPADGPRPREILISDVDAFFNGSSEDPLDYDGN
jgi:S-DNA-T family DNA segregation ATPase FtsK/SpoIIIE